MKLYLLQKRKSSCLDKPSTSSNVAEEELSSREQKLRRMLEHERSKSLLKSKRLKTMSQKVRRLKKRIFSLKRLVRELQSKNLLSDEHSLLFEHMPNICKEIGSRKIDKKRKYSPELRQFAITLSFFSPKGYNYVREKFQTCLPHQSTIAKWFSNVNCEPGFTKESLAVLKEYRENSEHPVLLSLAIDEMSIRKNVEWDGKKFHGYVDYGPNSTNDSNDVAKEALVFMANCVNGNWKIPIGYFFANGVNGRQKANLVTQAIKLISETGAQVVSLTFDGAKSNVAMANILGCNRDAENTKPFFTIKDKKYFVFYDPCHMIKLIRNTFGDTRHTLIDGEGNYIKWQYIGNLEDLQENEGLHLANKLRQAHVKFFNQKMKVRLAVQLLSESVADALSYCTDQLKLEQFKGCEATVKFIRIMNQIFDILNSRSIRAKGFKKALCKNNIEHTRKFVEEAVSYISGLKFDNGQQVIKSGLNTGFLGLIVSLKSAIGLYEEVVENNKNIVYFPVYKISQDHVELFFSSIRSKGGGIIIRQRDSSLPRISDYW